jgi:hypothetical protein
LAQNLQGYDKMVTQANQSNYNDRNATDADYMRSANMLKEMLANQGIQGGDAGTLGVSLANQNQNSLRQIDQNTSNILNDVAAKKGMLQGQAASNEEALIKALNASKSQDLFNLNQYGDQRAIQMDNQDYGRYRDMLNSQLQQDQQSFANQSAIANLLIGMRNSDRQFGLEQAGLTGTLNGQMTLPAIAQMAGLTGYLPGGQQTLAAQNQQFNQNMANQQFSYQQYRDQIGDERYKQQFDEDARRYGLDYALRKASQEGQLAISAQNAQTAANNANQAVADRQSKADQLKNANDISASVISELSQARNADEVNQFMSANSNEIIAAVGLEGYEKLLDQGLSRFTAQDKAAQSASQQQSAVRQKAISLAQSDNRWDMGVNRESLIQEYIKLLQ